MTERFISPSAPPEGYDREILTILVEECSEVQKRATKMLRFGVDEIQPGQALTNSHRLGLEIGDLFEVVCRVLTVGLTTNYAIAQGQESKRRQLEKYMQQQMPNREEWRR